MEVKHAPEALHLLGLETVLAHAVGAQDLEGDRDPLSGIATNGLQRGLKLAHRLDRLRELAGRHQRESSQDIHF